MKAIASLFILALTFAAGTAAAYEPHPLDQVMGKPDAPITIVEYASTTCGHCGTFHTQVLPKIKADWVDTGKAKLVYRDFPTGPAALSVGASMIAHCAGPDRYFSVLGYIFQQQEKWMSSKAPLDELKRIARLAGMKSEQVDACLQRQDLANGIQVRAQAAQLTDSIESTPTVIINGKKIVGVRPYEEYEKVLKAAVK